MLETIKTEQSNCYNLSLGEPHLSPFPIDAWADMARLQDAHRYYSFLGSSALRETLLKKYYPHLNMSNIAITHGAIGALDSIFRSSYNDLDKNEHQVLLPDPGFPPYEKLAEFSRLKIKKYNINFKNHDHQIDWDQLENQMSPAVRLILFNSPQNPTGRLFTENDRTRLLSILQKYPQLNFVMDEVYRELIFNDSQHVDLSPLVERGYVVGSFSKMYPLQGARVGWVVTSEKLMQKMIPYFSNAYGAISSFGQELALNFLKKDLNFSSNYIQARDVCEQVLNNYQIPHEIPQGGFYYFLNFNSDDRRVVDDLKNNGVIVIPGSVFGQQGRQHVRICFAQKTDDLVSAFQIIAKSWRDCSQGLM